MEKAFYNNGLNPASQEIKPKKLNGNGKTPTKENPMVINIEEMISSTGFEKYLSSLSRKKDGEAEIARRNRAVANVLTIITGAIEARIQKIEAVQITFSEGVKERVLAFYKKNYKNTPPTDEDSYDLRFKDTDRAVLSAIEKIKNYFSH